MVTSWIEAAAKGRLGGPVRAGMWSSVVVGTHPVEADQEVWLELNADDTPLGPLPAYWLENKGVNSFWHVPIPPQGVGSRLSYRSAARRGESPPVYSPYQDVIVRSNLPDRTEMHEFYDAPPEAIVGNRSMTARVDSRGGTYDIYYPTVGLHSDVRPAEGDLPQSRSHFRLIAAGLGAGRRLDWFVERSSWEGFQYYQGATNLLVTELNSRTGPIRVLATDLIAMGPDLPRTAGGSEAPGQYLKRYRLTNEGDSKLRIIFGLYVQAEVNGGVGDPGLSWHDDDRCLLASNRGHGHANRKLARDATIEFGIALDDRDEVHCEPTGPNEAILLRHLEIPAGGTAHVDVLVAGAFTGWRGDPGTYEHWIRPALSWFRSADLDRVEAASAAQWDAFVEPVPELSTPKPAYAVALRRASLAAALHCDSRWGAIAGGFDRGLNAYCLPRDALFAGAALDRVGHPEIGRAVFDWLGRVRGLQRPFSYWLQKYTIDGWPEWETPAVDQSALIPWAIEKQFRRQGDLERVASAWPMIEQAAQVALGVAGHPGLRFIEELGLISSSGLWDSRFGAFFYSNACVVAGLRSAARLGALLDKPADRLRTWEERADRVWNEGILSVAETGKGGPGLVDPGTGRFLEARRLSTLRGLWTDRPECLQDRSAAVDISALAASVPLGLIGPSDPRMRASAEAILRLNAVDNDPNALTNWTPEPGLDDPRQCHGEGQRGEQSSLATLWMARHLIYLGRETGEGRHWTRAVLLLDHLLGRLCPLGLGLRPRMKRDDPATFPARTTLGVWPLHASLIDALLDLAGLDYDAVDRCVTLVPTLAPRWPYIGLSQQFSCGTVAYRLSRSVGGHHYRLELRADLRHPIRVRISLTCPDLAELGSWQGTSGEGVPRFDRGLSRVQWAIDLPAGKEDREWSWGMAGVSEGIGV
ncbi:MAG: glycosyl hydrolase [Isosphaeraceae bacterium]